MAAALLLPVPCVMEIETSARRHDSRASAAPTAKEASKKRSRPNLSKVCLKTKMCSLFLKGECKRDKNCTFAHDPSEIQAKPDLSGTKMCPVLLKTGCCPRLATCKFAHREEDVRRLDIPEVPAPPEPFTADVEVKKNEVRAQRVNLPLPPIPVPRKQRAAAELASRLNSASAAGALTLGDMVVCLTSIFSAMFEARPEAADRAGVSASVLASVTAESAWADAGVSRESRLSFDEVASWCNLPFQAPPTASLTERTLMMKEKACSSGTSTPSTVDSEIASQCSTDAGAMSPFSLCSSSSGAQTPTHALELDLPVLNTFIHFGTEDVTIAPRRASSVPASMRRR